MTTTPSKELETFVNPQKDRDYKISIRMPEFTCLCPKTGQPDFATVFLDYTPDELCVELKSLKLYIWSFRDTGAFHEADLEQRLGSQHFKICSWRQHCHVPLRVSLKQSWEHC